ncbi:MAG: DUF3108 domain-containing protein [Bacteroidales bacterium]|nr:DUF3108 domain-containing protein [Bacteroidales bacterium]
MKKFLFFLAAVLLAGFAAEAKKLPADALGTHTYDVRYTWGLINAKVATGTITLEKSDWEGQATYHSSAIISANSIFSLFMGSAYTADIHLAQTDLQPVYFINPFKKNGKQGKFEYFYRKDKKIVDSITDMGTGDGSVETTFPLDGRTMDLLSLLHFVRFHEFSHAGTPVKLHLLMGGRSFPAELIWQGEDDERFPGRKAERILLHMTERGLMENGSGTEITVWRSDDETRMLLGLEAALSAGSMSVSIRE